MGRNSAVKLLLDADYNGSFTVEKAMRNIKSSFARLRQSNGRQDLTMGEGFV